MKTKIIIVLLVLVVVISCQNEEDNFIFDFSVENSFSVLNEYTSSDESLWFSINHVSDSRCPNGVTCIWQGEARVKIEVMNLHADTLVLSTYNNLKDTIGNYSFELIDVSPYPEINKELKQDDYLVNLTVRKLD